MNKELRDIIVANIVYITERTAENDKVTVLQALEYNKEQALSLTPLDLVRIRSRIDKMYNEAQKKIIKKHSKS